MAELLFYQLTIKPLERALPELLERSLERGWRCVVRTGSAERVKDLDTLLWTWRDDSFLPHGSRGSSEGDQQPIWITDNEVDNPNEAQALFLVDGMRVSQVNGYERCAVLFDGCNETMVVGAREDWRTAREGKQKTVYWLQNEAGRWEKGSQ
ncbi:MAG: DNA polymerase III subunit chi [Parvularculales bacterium]